MAERAVNDWRPLAAALANDRLRRAWAALVLDVSAGDVDRVDLDRLLASGLAVTDEDGGILVSGAPFRNLLRAHASAAPTGAARFLTGTRVRSWPASEADRIELLQWIADHAFPDDRELGEREVTDRLRDYSDDPALVRRYLVDAGMLDRTPSGSRYARAADPS